jgi:hypothetical protein
MDSDAHTYGPSRSLEFCLVPADVDEFVEANASSTENHIQTGFRR